MSGSTLKPSCFGVGRGLKCLLCVLIQKSQFLGNVRNILLLLPSLAVFTAWSLSASFLSYFLRVFLSLPQLVRASCTTNNCLLMRSGVCGGEAGGRVDGWVGEGGSLFITSLTFNCSVLILITISHSLIGCHFRVRPQCQCCLTSRLPCGQRQTPSRWRLLSINCCFGGH